MADKFEFKEIDINYEVLPQRGVFHQQLCYVDEVPKYLIFMYDDLSYGYDDEMWGTIILDLNRQNEDGSYQTIIMEYYMSRNELTEYFQKDDFWPDENKTFDYVLNIRNLGDLIDHLVD